MDNSFDLRNQYIRKAVQEINAVARRLTMRRLTWEEQKNLVARLNQAKKHLAMICDITKKPKKEITLGKDALIKPKDLNLRAILPPNSRRPGDRRVGLK